MQDIDDDFEITRKDAILGFVKDWGIALLLTALGFFLLSYIRAPNIPDQAPGWTLKNLNGEEVSLEDFRGQTVVLNFWATWCGPCKTEIPTLSKFAKENPNIPVLGIAVDGSAEFLRKASKKLKIDYPVLIADASVQQNYDVKNLPTTVIVDPTGQVKDVHVGMIFGPQLDWAVQ